MLLGRLEIVAALALFAPSAWFGIEDAGMRVIEVVIITAARNLELLAKRWGG